MITRATSPAFAERLDHYRRRVDRKLADILGTAPSQVILGDNASLSLMYDVISEACHRGVPGGARPWSREPAGWILCPSPGYDRHFARCA